MAAVLSAVLTGVVESLLDMLMLDRVERKAVC